MKHVVDTHALIWFLTGNTRLGPNARAVLSDLAAELVVPATALAEALLAGGDGQDHHSHGRSATFVH